jgi:hypothetical protein
MELRNCETEFPDEAVVQPDPPEELPAWPPAGTTPLRETVPRVPAIGQLRLESDRMAEVPLPPVSDLRATVIPGNPTAARLSSPVVIRKRKELWPLYEKFMVGFYILIVVFGIAGLVLYVIDK